MSFNIIYEADPATSEDAEKLATLRVELRNVEVIFEARARYIVNLIGRAYDFNVRYCRLYNESYNYIKSDINPIRVGVELSPKNKKLPLIKKEGIIMPDGRTHLWEVKEALHQKDGSMYQDFMIPWVWLYGGNVEQELKDGVTKWNALTATERSKLVKEG